MEGQKMKDKKNIMLKGKSKWKTKEIWIDERSTSQKNAPSKKMKREKYFVMVDGKRFFYGVRI